jgi:hypothetical protein
MHEFAGYTDLDIAITILSIDINVIRNVPKIA